jgi:magnesium chelatase subunit I
VAESVTSITELLEKTSARRFLEAPAPEDMGLAEHLPFPFLGIVGQAEMKLAMLLNLINPSIGGVLLIGPRGTGKTTAVRGLTELMPNVDRSLCTYGCLPEDIETGGMDAVCPDCAQKFAQGEPLTFTDRVRLIELPLNSRLDDVVGGLDERAAVHNRLRLDRGLLSRADQNVLYVDEVNLLADEIVDAILDASAQGIYTVHRGPLTATYRARFVLIGSMNPEEGRLRPQILDRFGLRVIIHGLSDREQRLEAYHRAVSYRNNPRKTVIDYEALNHQVREEINDARQTLFEMELTRQAENYGLKLIEELGIHSLRAEITLFEAAKAHALAAGRASAGVADIRQVAPFSLRLRGSQFIDDYLIDQQEEEEQIADLLDSVRKK